jgi:hypothetical protein
MRNLLFQLTICTAVLLLVNGLYAMEPNPFQQYEIQRLDINRSAMLVLGSWAVGNMLVGTYGHFNTTGQIREFHQFNFMWNVVNLGIAAFGYHQAATADPMAFGYVDILKEYNTLQNILLLNVGLNVSYMATGLYLRERSKNSRKYGDRLKGYGNSLLLQGAFLFVFDTSLFFIHRSHANLHLYPQLESLAAGGAGLGILFRF